MENIQINTSSGVIVLMAITAAGALLFGSWRGRPDLGWQALLSMTLTSITLSLLSAVLGFWLLGTGGPLQMMTFAVLLSHLVSLVPLVVAVHWVVRIRQDTQA